MDTEAKLNLLGDAAQFDVSAPGTSFSEALQRAEEELRLKAGCIFYAQTSGGRCVPVFKVLMSNECRNDCYYCATRCSANVPRERFTPEELAKTFLQLESRGLVRGLFLSSGVRDSPERTQEQMIQTVEILRRRYGYRGFIHLKVLPGVSDAAVEAAARLASRLSVNLEAPTVERLGHIAPDKRFREELLRPLMVAAEIQRRGLMHSGLTTQFVVGAGGESDAELLRATDWLYRHAALRRAYFSGFRPIPGSPLEDVPAASVTRVHRLYQADFLLRFYGFALADLPLDGSGSLPQAEDPKLAAARAHPERFPVEVNTASREELLRVPGIGPRSAKRIVEARRQRSITSPQALRALGVRAERAREFLTFGGRLMPRLPL